MLLEILVALVFAVLFVKTIPRRYYETNRFLKDIPGPKGIPLVGNIEIGMKSNEEILPLLQSYLDSYGQRYKLHLGPNPIVVLTKAQDVEKLASSVDNIEKSSDYDFMIPWLGNGLLIAGGGKWRSRRKMLTPTFHFKILEQFLTIMNEHSKHLTLILRDNHHTDGRSFDISPYITRTTLGMICETVMGKKLEDSSKADLDYIEAVKEYTAVLIKRIFSPWLYPDLIWKVSRWGRVESKLLRTLHEFTSQVIKERKSVLFPDTSNIHFTPLKDPVQDYYGKKSKAFMDLLLEAQRAEPSSISDLEIREETDTFMFAGHDTTASCLNWTIFLLGSYPILQSKVHDELSDIFGGDTDRPLTSDDLSKMKYLEMCIKESLRIYPSAPFFGRKLTKNLQLDEKTTIPAKTLVWVHPYFTHRDPNVYSDPEKFIPERFSAENSSGRNPYSYIPFSAGPRNCIGQKFAMMELKVILAYLLRSFTVKSMESREDIIVKCEIITKPKNGVRIQLEERK